MQNSGVAVMVFLVFLEMKEKYNNQNELHRLLDFLPPMYLRILYSFFILFCLLICVSRACEIEARGDDSLSVVRIENREASSLNILTSAVQKNLFIYWSVY